MQPSASHQSVAEPNHKGRPGPEEASLSAAVFASRRLPKAAQEWLRRQHSRAIEQTHDQPLQGCGANNRLRERAALCCCNLIPGRACPCGALNRLQWHRFKLHTMPLMASAADSATVISEHLRQHALESRIRSTRQRWMLQAESVALTMLQTWNQSLSKPCAGCRIHWRLRQQLSK